MYACVSKYTYSGLLEILVNINSHKHYLIINAKFHSATINNVHTMSLADMLAAPQKSYGWQHSFQILSIFHATFVMAIGQLTWGVSSWSTFEYV